MYVLCLSVLSPTMSSNTNTPQTPISSVAVVYGPHMPDWYLRMTELTGQMRRDAERLAMAERLYAASIDVQNNQDALKRHHKIKKSEAARHADPLSPQERKLIQALIS